MNEGLYSPTSTEVNKAAENMWPWQAAMSRAREEVMTKEPDFIAAGLTPDNVKAVADKAGERAKLEFEQKQGEDPIRHVIGVMQKCAETDEEKIYADERLKALESQRSEWKDWVKRVKMYKTQRGEEFSLEDVLNRGNWIIAPPTFTKRDSVWYEDGKCWSDTGTCRSSFNVGWINYRDLPNSPNLVKFHEKVLHGLGVLSEGQTSADLQNNPVTEVSRGKGPTLDRSTGIVRHLPTELAATEVTGWVDGSRIDLNLTVSALEKVIEFPSS